MPLFFSGNTSDNVHYSIPAHSLIADIYTSRGKGMIQGIKLDKISLVFNPHNESKMTILQRLNDLHGTMAPKGGLVYSKTTTYHKGYALSIGQGLPKVLIQAQPKNQKASFFRVEFNPNKLGSQKVIGLFETLENWLGPDFGGMHIRHFATVTTVDVALDFLNVSVGDILLSKGDDHKSHAYFSGEGRMETLYAGIHKSAKNGSLKVYNKAQEMQEHGYCDPLLVNVPASVPVTRLEVKARSKLILKNLGQLSNPFSELNIYHVRDQNGPDGKAYWRWFVDSCRMRGIDRVLAGVETEKAKLYFDELCHKQKFVFDADMIWERWEKSLNESGLMKIGLTKP